MLPEALPALPAPLARFESPVARIVAQLLDEVAPAVERAAARYGASRVAVVLGTSVGGLAVTEDALAAHHATGAFPAGYDLHARHSLHAAVDLACARLGLRGPRFAVSTACSSSGKVFATAQRLLRAGVVDAVPRRGRRLAHADHAAGLPRAERAVAAPLPPLRPRPR